MIEPITALQTVAGSINVSANVLRYFQSKSPNARVKKWAERMDDSRRQLLFSAKYIKQADLAGASNRLENTSQLCDQLREKLENKSIHFLPAFLEARSLAIDSREAVEAAQRLSSKALRQQLKEEVAASTNRKVPAAHGKPGCTGRPSSESLGAITPATPSCECDHSPTDLVSQPTPTIILSAATSLLCPVHNPFALAKEAAPTLQEQERVVGIAMNLIVIAVILESVSEGEDILAYLNEAPAAAGEDSGAVGASPAVSG
ncbi:hypothetical protein BDN72DRAFT_893282 [Pluteus cervinus]|uniref:Uncharacterized protein n=1 Tax=Pluteus cervinus TaxID=181527 RepID=A0ACD3B8R7_9AGAR|nr:hypothetical protein BDN72DRAFT_893282 [Pluteus cervinus]